MIRAVRVLTITAVALSGAAASANPLETAWCSDNESMNIDAYGIGFNAHTVCDVENMPVTLDANDKWSSPATCKNVHVLEFREDGNHEIHETPIAGLTQLELQGAPDGTLILRTDRDETDMHFLPCGD